jgi:hypothetical protein
MNLVYNKEHLEKEGLIKILRLKASLNNGLLNKLRSLFPEIIKVNKPYIAPYLNINFN